MYLYIYICIYTYIYIYIYTYTQTTDHKLHLLLATLFSKIFVEKVIIFS